MKLIGARLTVLLALVWAFQVGGEPPLQEARTTLEKWVETRGLISKTRSDWQSDKEMLEQTIQLLERELKGVEEQMSKLSTNSTQAEKERAQTDESLKASNEALEQAKQFATTFEAKLLKVVPELPLSLQESPELRKALNRIPTDPATTKTPATERVQVIVGILNELDKFNNAVSLFSEKRKTDKGDEVACETLYVGLGAAYFVNDSGDFAGTGSPGPKGWEWTSRPEIASSVREAVRIYRNEKPARFIPLPAVIK
jgi:hypothetical protein